MVPVMDWLQLGFSWFLCVASVVAWVATTGKSDDKLWFWLIMAFGWAFFGIAELLIIVSEFPADEWTISALRIVGWSILAIAVCYSVWTLSQERFF